MLWREITLFTHPTATVTFYSVDCSITGFQPQIPSADMVVMQQGTDLCVLQRLKGLSLAGRGISFTQMDQLREALRDLQLSMQAFPGMHTIAIFDTGLMPKHQGRGSFMSVICTLGLCVGNDNVAKGSE